MAGKRGHNEGSIYKITTRAGKVVWVAAVTLTDGRRRTRRAKTRREAQEKLGELLRDIAKPEPSTITMAAYVEDWLERRRPTIEPATEHLYAGINRLFLVPALGRTKLVDLTPLHIQQAVDGWIARKTGARRLHQVMRLLKTMLEDAVDLEIIERNPARRVHTPTPPPRSDDVPALTAEQAERVINAMAGHRIHGLVITALGLGLRLGEVTALSWSDLTDDWSAVTLRQQLQRMPKRLRNEGDPVYRLKRLKTARAGRTARTIPVPPFLRDVLHIQRAQQERDRAAAAAAGRPYPPTDLIFTQKSGAPLNSSLVQQAWNRRLARAGLRKMHFHDLRHGASSLWLRAGVHPRVVMEMLGHSEIGMTLRIYSHVAPELLTEAAERMDATLRDRLGLPHSKSTANGRDISDEQRDTLGDQRRAAQ